MKVTNEELFTAIVAVDNHLRMVEDLLHGNINMQQQIEKVMIVNLPGMTPEQRQHFQAGVMRRETDLDHLEAATRDWRKQFDAFIKRVRDRK